MSLFSLLVIIFNFFHFSKFFSHHFQVIILQGYRRTPQRADRSILEGSFQEQGAGESSGYLTDLASQLSRWLLLQQFMQQLLHIIIHRILELIHRILHRIFRFFITQNTSYYMYTRTSKRINCLPSENCGYTCRMFLVITGTYLFLRNCRVTLYCFQYEGKVGRRSGLCGSSLRKGISRRFSNQSVKVMFDQHRSNIDEQPPLWEAY